MRKIFLFLLAWNFSFSQDALMPFATGISGNLDVYGTTGFGSSPARIGEPSIYFSCDLLLDKDVWGCGGGGVLLLWQQRVSFFTAYQQMDSLYSQVYSEVDAAYHWKPVILGAAYGLSMEWMPGVAKWARHRYKGGVSFLVGEGYVSAMMDGWLSSYEKSWKGHLGAGVRLDGLGLAYGEWDGTSFILGNEISWSYFRLRTSYGFPDFSVAVGLSVSLGLWESAGTYGFSSENWSWIEAGGIKRF